MKQASYFHKIFAINLSTHISSAVSNMIASFMGLSSDALIYMLAASMAFNPRDPNWDMAFFGNSTVEVLPKVPITD